MITKTVNLDSSYDSLFDEIRTKSEGRIDINNIEGFFGNIEEIAALDEKFLRLPLDEPLFEIDANTRRIEVPVDFRSNGISVQGDHLAETVFFSIDRYFDYMDLASTNIYINWKMGNESGRTKHFILSTDILPGKIVFGWPVDKIVTQKSGSLQFAIEFNKTNSEGITYRFNTLASNVNIKDGLVIDENAEVSVLNNDIRRMLTNSSFGEGDAAVNEAHWLTGNGHGLVVGGNEHSFSPQPWQEVLNLKTLVSRDGEPSSISVDLYASAYVDSQTSVRYTDNDGNSLEVAYIEIARNYPYVTREERANLNPEVTYLVREGTGPSAEFRAATEEELADESVTLYYLSPLDTNLKYYIKLEETEPVAYRDATEEEIADWANNNEIILYTKLAKVQVVGADSYIIKAQGEKYAFVEDENVKNKYTEAIATLESIGAEVPEELLAKAEEVKTITKKIGAGPVKVSDVVVVPAAKAPESIVIEGEDIENFTPEGPDPDPERDGVYSIDESAENVIFIPDGGRNLKAIAEFENLGASQIIWQKGVSGTGTNMVFQNVSEGNTPYTLTNSSVLENAEEGSYRVLVNNFVNNTTSETATSDTFIVSKLASPIVSASRQYKFINNSNPQGVFLDIAENGSVNFYPNRSMSYQYAVVQIANVVLDGENSTGTSYEWYMTTQDINIDENIEWELISTEQQLKTNVEGFYKPVVKNICNGSIYTKELKPFSIDRRE